MIKNKIELENLLTCDAIKVGKRDERIAELEAENKRLRERGEWQPMETFPVHYTKVFNKNGDIEYHSTGKEVKQRCLVLYKNNIYFGTVGNPEEVWLENAVSDTYYEDSTIVVPFTECTGWRELPSLPQKEGEG